MFLDFLSIIKGGLADTHKDFHARDCDLTSRIYTGLKLLEEIPIQIE